jgi:predicted ATPase/DNA-binding XRE family transcriptional regulator
MMAEAISFGRWLRQRRRALDLTQKAFADQIGCAEITVRRMEADQYKPSNELAVVLFKKLGIPESEHHEWVRFARGFAEYPKNQTIRSPAREQITNLPIPLTSFIGRKKDIALIQQRLAGYRLVTLIGAGGIGKTRLSQHVASQLLGEYANGVWLVELAPLSDPSLVLQTVAAVFGIQEGANDRALMETLVYFLGAKSLLLILDNCEHLLDSCAGLADKLLKNCPNLKILATSRESLGIIGEALYQVPSLTIPEMQRLESIEKLNGYESIRLFNERAQLVQMDFSLTKENAASIAQICSRLDGIPLAIELAAVRVQMFSTDQIASQLNECFHTLTGGSRTALPRHQTLQASIDWSWYLLYDAEQTVLRRLAVFAGGFTLEAAGQVCSGLGIESRQIVGVISHLVTKSLVVVNQQSGRERRYRLLETIRQYARQKLIEAGEEENIQTQHVQYYLQLSEQAEPGLRGPKQVEWMSRLHEERDDIRAALEWVAKTNVEAGLYLASRLDILWEDVEIREATRWLEVFTQQREAKAYPHARAKALRTLGWLRYRLQRFPEALSNAQECLDLYRACGDMSGELDALLLFVVILNPSEAAELYQQALTLTQSINDKWRTAYTFYVSIWVHHDRRSYLEKALALFQEVGDLRYRAECLASLGRLEIFNNDLESAQKRFDEALYLFRQLNIKSGISDVLFGYGRIAGIKGDYEQAYHYLQESAAFTEQFGYRIGYLFARSLLGYLALQQGKVTEAHAIFTQTVRSFFDDKNEIGVAFNLEGMAGLSATVGKHEIAAKLIGWADALRKRIGDHRPPLEQAEVDKIIAACVAKMGEVEFSDAYEEGKKMTLDEAVAYALRES